MKMTTYQPKLVTERDFAGLLKCRIEHTVTSASGVCEWTGPKIDPAEWNKMLAFFQWVYDTTQSEAQVRWFVNSAGWKCWAFPQEAKSGCTSREIDTADMKEQLRQFADDFYLGTCHHHCGMTAFQSGTDYNNEVGIDGLHITIGMMNAGRYDMHSRFYLRQHCFEPDMSRFWDIGDELKTLLPVDLWGRVAAHQMCAKVAPETEFPAQWKTNLIEVKTTFPLTTTGKGWTPGASQSSTPSTTWQNNSKPDPDWLRARRAVGELASYTIGEDATRLEMETLAKWIEEIARNQVDLENPISELIDICRKYDVDAMDMWQEIPADNDLAPCINSYQTHLKFSQKQLNDSKPQDTVDDADYHGGYGRFMGME